MKAFLVALVMAMFKYVVDVFTPKAKSGQKPGPLEDRLKDKIRKDGWGKGGRAGLLLAMVVVGPVLGACAPTSSRTVYVPPGKAVQIRETVKDAKVWVMGQDGLPIAGVMDLPEGWYALPDPGEDADGRD